MFDSTLITGRLSLALWFTIAIALSGCKGGDQALTSTLLEPAQPSASRTAQSSRSDITSPSGTQQSDREDSVTETPVAAVPDTSESTKNNSNSVAREASNGSSTPSLSWVAPATRADGSKLYTGEIKGYRIYYKLRHENSYQVIQLSDATRTRLKLTNFKAGVYEFAVTTLDTDGLESTRSKAVSVNII